MKRTFLIAVLICLLALAGCGAFGSGEKTVERATQIAEFDVPQGFTPGFSADLAGVVMVTFDHVDGRSHIFVTQAPESANITREELEASLRQSLASSSAAEAVETAEVEEIPLTIRGETVTGTIGVGTSSTDNAPYCVLTVPFTGNNGPAILLYQRPESSWDQAEVDAFIASFR